MDELVTMLAELTCDTMEFVKGLPVQTPFQTQWAPPDLKKVEGVSELSAPVPAGMWKCPDCGMAIKESSHTCDRCGFHREVKLKK